MTVIAQFICFLYLEISTHVEYNPMFFKPSNPWHLMCL
uniref:Uncharacterized protein n=1 Tax=Anguilla anguilla TaxID=7936 RepID=A0A0E9SIV4_ANGAN